MKLLVFTDTHSDKEMIDKVKEKSKKADILICLGDLTTFQAHMSTILKELNSLKKPVIMIHGNHESEDTISDMIKNLKNIYFIHEKTYELDNLLILGYGGGGFSIEDIRFEKISAKWEKLLSKKNDKKIILITHGPPFETDIDLISKKHVGNKSYTKFIKKNKIDYVFSGHLHENFYKTGKLGKTTVMNPGPEGRIIII